jgi:hypothetical protein
LFSQKNYYQEQFFVLGNKKWSPQGGDSNYFVECKPSNQTHPEAQIKNFDFIATIEVAIFPT